MDSIDVELVSTKKAAQLLSVTQKTILNMIHDGRLEATKLGNATSPWRIRKDSIMKYRGTQK
jgi:excisionase family DNA binding protein